MHPLLIFVASLAQWMCEAGKTSMDDVMLAQVTSLRGQMNSSKPIKKAKAA